MDFRKNVHFYILIKIEGRLREINFRKRADDKYDGDTSDEQGRRWLFIWEEKDGDWQLTPKDAKLENLPLWLINNTASIKEVFLAEIP